MARARQSLSLARVSRFCAIFVKRSLFRSPFFASTICESSPARRLLLRASAPPRARCRLGDYATRGGEMRRSSALIGAQRRTPRMLAREQTSANAPPRRLDASPASSPPHERVSESFVMMPLLPPSSPPPPPPPPPPLPPPPPPLGLLQAALRDVRVRAARGDGGVHRRLARRPLAAARSASWALADRPNDAHVGSGGARPPAARLPRRR